MGWVGAVIAAVGAAASAQQQREARTEQRKAREEQSTAQAERAAQEKRQQIREERIKRAQIIQASENTGVSASSGLMGAESGLSTQLSTSLGFGSAQALHVANISMFGQNAADAMGRAQTASQVSQLGMSIFSGTGGFSGLSSRIPEDWRAAGTSNTGPTRGIF